VNGLGVAGASMLVFGRHIAGALRVVPMYSARVTGDVHGFAYMNEISLFIYLFIYYKNRAEKLHKHR